MALANKLGKLLIAPASQRSGAGASRKRSAIIAGGGTSPSLGRVPFGLLGLGTDGVHLAHRAVVRLGASAALLEQIRRREQGQFYGRVLGVIDFCGRNVARPSGERGHLELAN